MDFKEPENPEKPQLSEKELLTNIVGILKPKETVAKALQRLGNKQGKSKVLPNCYFINVNRLKRRNPPCDAPLCVVSSFFPMKRGERGRSARWISSLESIYFRKITCMEAKEA